MTLPRNLLEDRNKEERILFQWNPVVYFLYPDCLANRSEEPNRVLLNSGKRSEPMYPENVKYSKELEWVEFEHEIAVCGHYRLRPGAAWGCRVC
jgi:hypothetical protein